MIQDMLEMMILARFCKYCFRAVCWLYRWLWRASVALFRFGRDLVAGLIAAARQRPEASPLTDREGTKA